MSVSASACIMARPVPERITTDNCCAAKDSGVRRSGRAKRVAQETAECGMAVRRRNGHGQRCPALSPRCCHRGGSAFSRARRALQRGRRGQENPRDQEGRVLRRGRRRQERRPGQVSRGHRWGQRGLASRRHQDHRQGRPHRRGRMVRRDQPGHQGRPGRMHRRGRPGRQGQWGRPDQPDQPHPRGRQGRQDPRGQRVRRRQPLQRDPPRRPGLARLARPPGPPARVRRK